MLQELVYLVVELLSVQHLHQVGLLRVTKVHIFDWIDFMNSNENISAT